MQLSLSACRAVAWKRRKKIEIAAPLHLLVEASVKRVPQHAADANAVPIPIAVRLVERAVRETSAIAPVFARLSQRIRFCG